MSDIYVKICADTEMTADGLVEKLKVFENLHTSKKEMDIILNTLDLELQNNKVEVLKEDKKVVGLNFSEHDKVFEDKIAKLKKDYKTASELLGKYQQENESLKKRIIELENFSCQAEQETESLVEKLNQRIAELEKSRSEWIDKTVEWQQKCEKLEIKEAENTVCVRVSASPIEIATHLINNTCTINELKMITEHINVYCNGGK